MSAPFPATPSYDTPVGVMWGAGPQITAADDAFLRIIGYTQDDLAAGRIDWRVMTPPEFLHLDEAGMRQAAASGGFTVPYQKEFFRKDGSRVPVLLVCAFIPNQPDHWIGYAVDLSPRRPSPAPRLTFPPQPIAPAPDEFYRRLVGELVNERNRLRAVLDNTPSPIWSLDHAFRLLSGNEAFNVAIERLAGRRAEIGDNVLELSADPEQRALWQSWYDRALQGHPVQGETRSSVDGRVAARDHTISPMIDQAGAVYGVSVVSHDVSARIMSEDALRVSESRFRTLASASSLGIFLADPAGNYLYVNDRLASMLGLSAAELLSYGILRQVHHEDRGRVSAELERATQAGADLVSEFRIQRVGADGNDEVRALRLWLSAVVERDRRTGFVGTVDDETERLRSATQAKQSERMESLGALAGGIAHDFNNMLAVVVANVDLALGEPDVPAVVIDELESISIASLRARELIRQILTFSRQTDTKHGAIDLTALAVESVRLLRSTMTARVHLEVALPPEPVIISGNASELQQVLVNLCVNAEHAVRSIAMPAIAVTLQTERDASGRHLAVLTVQDNGIGMPPDTARRIFEPFFTTKSVGEGTGMGLAVAHGAVLAHGGTISVDTAPGEGTSFRIELPLASREPTPRMPETSAVSTSGGTLLLVDDEPALSRALAKALQRRGYTVVTSHDGLDALRLLDHGSVRPDLILSDVAMPNMSGDRLAEELRVRYPAIPVVLMTGFSRDVSPDDPRGANVVDVVQKPMSIDTLVEIITRTLER
ncbi:hybrid sensor histidine kinase/response regulator [Gemmatimonas groenlandica]|uniref:histidine kinase n=1 Tax=Gemmatimonas groenlandica TaxID=2732249 RepID=A0A6M4ISW9_9BACT|nr:PAS domain-containing sensor histidine kinase [Gemmatimonas groenlandica]QJR36809.1 PAS domain S-box protein [Gemmatimonas groenlandica]